MAGASVTSLVGTVSVNPRPREAAQARSAYAPTMCWARAGLISVVMASMQSSSCLLVAGTVLSVALFVVEPEAVMSLVLGLVKSRHARSHQTITRL